MRAARGCATRASTRTHLGCARVVLKSVARLAFTIGPGVGMRQKSSNISLMHIVGHDRAMTFAGLVSLCWSLSRTQGPSHRARFFEPATNGTRLRTTGRPVCPEDANGRGIRAALIQVTMSARMRVVPGLIISRNALVSHVSVVVQVSPVAAIACQRRNCTSTARR